MDPNDRLDSWKEIAQYLNKEIRTVARWEKERGLPVYRVPGGKRQAVFAYKSELDAWLHGEGAAEEDSPPRAAWFRKPITLVLAGALLATAAVAGIWWRWDAKEPVDRVEFRGRQLRALDSQGELLWSYELPREARAFSGREADWRVQRFDFQRDGRQELVVLPVFPLDQESRARIEEVFCFNENGKLLWRYTPDLPWRPEGKHFPGPWIFHDALTTGEHDRFLWLAVSHHTWWPSFVVRLDGRGASSIRFLNSGWIMRLAKIRNPSGELVLAGGVSNEFEAGVFAVLDPNAPPASSPHKERNRFACEDCPAAGPKKYFVLPRSELNRASLADLNFAQYVRVYDHQVQVRTIEASPVPGIQKGALAVWTFSAGLRPESVSVPDGYWEMHRYLEQRGAVRHTLERCPERRHWPIHTWEPDHGWAQSTVPLVTNTP